jgi:hypothetical protein
MIKSVSGMYDELQGISGKKFKDIEGLDIKMLDDNSKNNS